MEAIGDQITPSHGFGDVVTGASASDGAVTAGDAFGTPGGNTPFAPDEGGFLTIARECPDLPDIPLPEFMGGQVIDLNAKFVHFCTFMGIGGTFIYLFGLLASIKIYSRVFT